MLLSWQQSLAMRREKPIILQICNLFAKLKIACKIVLVAKLKAVFNKNILKKIMLLINFKQFKKAAHNCTENRPKFVATNATLPKEQRAIAMHTWQSLKCLLNEQESASDNKWVWEIMLLVLVRATQQALLNFQRLLALEHAL